MSLNNKYCNSCNHKCHCVGSGYYVSTGNCDVCICEDCDCGPVILGARVERPWWKKVLNWLFN